MLPPLTQKLITFYAASRNPDDFPQSLHPRSQGHGPAWTHGNTGTTPTTTFRTDLHVHSSAHIGHQTARIIRTAFNTAPAAAAPCSLDDCGALCGSRAVPHPRTHTAHMLDSPQARTSSLLDSLRRVGRPTGRAAHIHPVKAGFQRLDRLCPANKRHIVKAQT